MRIPHLRIIIALTRPFDDLKLEIQLFVNFRTCFHVARPVIWPSENLRISKKSNTKILAVNMANIGSQMALLNRQHNDYLMFW